MQLIVLPVRVTPSHVWELGFTLFALEREMPVSALSGLLTQC